MQTFVTSKDVASIGEAHVKLMLEALRDRAPPADHERLWGPIVKAAAKHCRRQLTRACFFDQTAVVKSGLLLQKARHRRASCIAYV